jgi:5,10-methenyltetrahydrofolate synthetase
MSLYDRAELREHLIAQRQALADRAERSALLQSVLRVWLVSRTERSIGGYWPIKGEFDPLPALYRWSEVDAARRIGLPVMDKTARTLRFHVWFPGCPMEPDAYNIPKPKGTESFHPQMLLVPCVGYGPMGVRMGYGGGFYDRTVAALQPRPFVVGLAYSNGFVPDLKARPKDLQVDAVLTEQGVHWQRSD